MSLHTHGHKVTIEAKDGVRLSEEQEVIRDVVTLTAAQRLDLTLNTTIDGLHSYGRGVWFLHDHRESAVTTDGISPGGDVSLIVYRTFLREGGMPITEVNLSEYFDPAYYEGEIPLWRDLDPPRFGAPPETADDRADGGHLPIRDTSSDPLSPALLAIAALGLFGTIAFVGGMAVLLYLGGEPS